MKMAMRSVGTLAALGSGAGPPGPYRSGAVSLGSCFGLVQMY